MALHEDQIAMCRRYGAIFEETRHELMVGVSRNIETDVFPLHGLRHLAEGQSCGWFLWRGDFSEADDFFQVVHASHLEKMCPDVLPYLGLAPGWRFQLAPDYADVWYDVKLLGVITP